MELNIWVAFWAGLASFISPCCLPLYPSYISYITGISVSNLKTKQNKEIRMKTMTHTLFFILGFSVVYYTLGLSAGILAEVFSGYDELISQIAGLLIIVMGLFLLGVFKPQLLMKEVKFKWATKPAGYLGTFLIGIGFAAGWSPCVGPILGAIVALAATEPGIWFELITAYTLGFAIPFFIMAFFIGSTKWILKHSNTIMKIGGAMMIVIGILLFTGQMTKITIWLNSITPSWLQF
ncbi:cytochrome c biogenesis CcdA family protein [Chengkuizengella marina]|uniref:Cytochrome c biogenesis protein CcdA n=1 Tax=Chengkuizengella marina TaxID=2507566 RepID=A0A6N9Q0N7_9BACL|nr:cytochrome c biogenesis protein CcdA [Chengkuizengella marina]NBI27544.1 cytochrome c biogenesis protein CcdA [Chengkuizengella marina]